MSLALIPLIVLMRAENACGSSAAIQPKDASRKEKKSACRMVELRLHSPLKTDGLAADSSSDLGPSADFAKRGHPWPLIIRHHHLRKIVEVHVQHEFIVERTGMDAGLSRHVCRHAMHEQRGHARNS